MINILIVEDSQTETILLKNILESQPDMKVIGCAKDGNEAVKMTSLLKPDLITMDLQMPVMDGHTATRLIMAQNPTPIVVISSKLNNSMMDMTYLALEAGAVYVLEKPFDVLSNQSNESYKYLIDTIRSMAEIKVIKRRFNISKSPNKIITVDREHQAGSFELVVIGTSIGGPQALQVILSALPKDFPVPIVIVQHMMQGYIDGFTKWLNNNISLKVKSASHNEYLQKNVIYFAPDHHHLIVKRHYKGLVAKLNTQESVAGFCPSISVLFQSVAETCGNKAIGVLLTGMGSDGAEGLLALKKSGSHTIIQDKNSCVVFGMAGVAESLGAQDKIIELNQIADYLIKMCNL